MRYDLHIHLPQTISDDILTTYEIAIRNSGLKVGGFVVHYTEKYGKRTFKNLVDLIATLGVKTLAGVEIYYPSTTVPSGAEYTLIHFRDIIIDHDEILKISKLNNPIIAHPLSYNSKFTSEAMRILKKYGITVEYNSAHISPEMHNFYRTLKAYGVEISFGSDAHTPYEICAGFERAMEFITPVDELGVMKKIL